MFISEEFIFYVYIKLLTILLLLRITKEVKQNHRLMYTRKSYDMSGDGEAKITTLNIDEILLCMFAVENFILESVRNVHIDIKYNLTPLILRLVL